MQSAEFKIKVRFPPVLAANEVKDGNSVTGFVLPGWNAEASVTEFKQARVAGYELTLDGDTEPHLLITNGTIAPPHFDRVLRKRQLIVDGSAKELDLSQLQWEKHPGSVTFPSKLSHFENLVSAAVDSWADSFSYVREDSTTKTGGLRPPQLGAVHAAQSHFTVHTQPATIVMPTGTGKTETMLSILVAEQCSRLLVIVPTDALRTQIAEKFLSFGVLKQFGVVSEDALYPIVGILRRRPKDTRQLTAFLRKCNVVVTTMALVGQWKSDVQAKMSQHFTHLFIDEAHHVRAPKWEAFRDVFEDAKILQFTATPYRNDDKPVGGHLIFNYPLGQAQDDGYFKPIDFQAVVEFDPKRRDRAVADAAIEQLRADYDKGHILMARVRNVKRAEEVFTIYKEHPEFNPVQMHTGITSKTERDGIRKQILSGEARIVVCVDMLGEGFDLPELKIAAFHDVRHSLPITLQLAGRFTRARTDLGNATFIANIADVNVKEELRKLYQRDVDWNRLLPRYSDKAITDEFDLWEFLGGFKKFPDEISLQNVHPAMSCVAYKTKCKEWEPENFLEGIKSSGSLDRVYHDVNTKEDTLVVLTTRRVPLDWAKIDDIYSWDWQLYILYWDRDQKLLFIHNSSNAGFFKALAQAVCGEDIEAVKGPPIFRCLATVNRLRLNNVGLLQTLGRLIRYTMRAGSDVESGLSEAQMRSAIKSNLFGSGFENGHRTTIGCSYKGRIWSHQKTDLLEFKRWCQAVGTNLINESLDPNTVLDGTLRPELISERPESYPIAVDWPDTIYKSSTLTTFSFGDEEAYLHDAEIELKSPGEDGELIALVSTPAGEIELGLDFIKTAGNADFRFVRKKGQATITRGSQTEDLATFFGENPPVIWFANGSSLRGNELVQLRNLPDPFPKARIEAWKWAGINIKKESQGFDRKKGTVQYRVIQELKRRMFTVLFDDDGSGESADVVAILEEDAAVHVEFYHCKFSGGDKPSNRIKDLYEVCGQAQKCINYMEDPASLFTHLLRREPRCSGSEAKASTRFEVGDKDDLLRIREKSSRTVVTLKVFIVQPGLSRAMVSRAQLELLGVTENYLKETFAVPFGVIASD